MKSRVKIMTYMSYFCGVIMTFMSYTVYADPVAVAGAAAISSNTNTNVNANVNNNTNVNDNSNSNTNTNTNTNNNSNSNSNTNNNQSSSSNNISTTVTITGPNGGLTGPTNSVVPMYNPTPWGNNPVANPCPPGYYPGYYAWDRYICIFGRGY